ncbi:MAG: tripartite tricarboxylate transporter TctB family protein [Usitatibacter sp.]
MPPFARSGDFWSGLVLAALGTYIVVSARGWEYMGEDGPGPGFFPLWYGGAMIVLSLALVAGAVLGRRAAGPPLPMANLGRALLCWAAFVACIALMHLAGFIVAFALLTWFVIAVMARRPQRVALPIAIGAALGFHALFTWALEVSLPRGILF